jgi:hypothetical protein
LAMYYPMVETAHLHIKFNPKIWYIRNLFSEIVGFKVDRKIQIAAAKEVKLKAEYKAVEAPVYRNLDEYKTTPVNLCILCGSQIQDLEQTIRSIEASIAHLGAIQVVYIGTTGNKAVVQQLATNPRITLWSYSPRQNNLKATLCRALTNDSKHTVLATNRPFENKKIDFAHAAYWLEKTFAATFHFNLSLSQAPEKRSWLVELDEEVCAWKYKFGTGAWKTQNPFNAVLYRTKELAKVIMGCQVSANSKEIALDLKRRHYEPSKIGLFYN